MRMLFLLIILLLYCGLAASGQSVQEIEDSIIYYHNGIEKYSYDNYDISIDSEVKYDSLMFFNYALLKYLNTTLPKQPLSLRAKFAKVPIIISSSTDGKFRIYSWNAERPTSTGYYFSIIQYKTSYGCNTQIIHPTYEMATDTIDERYEPGFFYPKIYSIKAKNNNSYYLAFLKGSYQSSHVHSGVTAFKIENNKVNDSVKIFKTKRECVNRIDFDYNGYLNYNHKTNEEYYTIHMSPDNKKLYIPIVVEDFKITSRCLVYVFDGNNYVFDENAK